MRRDPTPGLYRYHSSVQMFFLNFLALLQKMNPIDLLADGSPPNNLSLSLIPFAATPPQDTELVLHAGSLDAAGSSG